MSYLARRYAQALYDTGISEPQITKTVQSIMENPVLWEALLSPMIRPRQKADVLAALPDLANAPILLRFFQLITENRRMPLLPDITAEFHAITLEAQNSAECVMTCVHIPNEHLQANLKSQLCKLHNKSQVILIFRIDPMLIGGFILTIEGVTYDRSVRGRLLGLSRYLEEVNAT